MKHCFSFLFVTVFLALSVNGQTVRLYFKNGNTMLGSLISLSPEKTEIDPEGQVSYYASRNEDLDSLIYLKDNKVLVYPISISTKSENPKPDDSTLPKRRSIFSFGLIGGRSATITTMAFDGFSDTKIKPSFMFGGSAMYFLTNGVAFELMVSHNKSRIIENNDDLGTLSMTPIIINYKMQTKPRKKAGVGVSVDIGMGFALTGYQNGPAIRQIEEDEKVTISISTNNPFMFNLGFGLDVFFCRQVSLGTDLRILAGNVKTDWKFNGISSQLSEKIYASSFILDFELRYWLDR